MASKLADLIVRGWNFPFPLEGLGGITGRRNFWPKLIGLWCFAQLSTPL
jgi:hypothetical protein